MVEIRWHARGGQGAKIASEMFAGILFKAGKYVQSFPEFGPERTGAPITAFNRVADKKMRMNHNIYKPDVLVIVDPTLIKLPSVLEGIKENGTVLINVSEENFEKLKIQEELDSLGKNLNIYIINADKISEDELGRVFPNISLMSALINILKIPSKEEFFKIAKEEIKEKFSQKEDVIPGNIKALERAYDEVIKI